MILRLILVFPSNEMYENFKTYFVLILLGTQNMCMKKDKKNREMKIQCES